MKKIISILTLVVFLLSSVSVFASENGIVIDNYEYDPTDYIINLSGKINGNMTGIPVTMQIKSSSNDILLAEQTTSSISDNKYSFEVKLPIDLTTGDYTVEVSEILYETKDQKTLSYNNIMDLYEAVSTVADGILTATKDNFATVFVGDNGENYDTTLGVDKTKFTDLSDTAREYALAHIKSLQYSVPTQAEVMSDPAKREELKQTAVLLKQAYLEGIAIGEYQDIATATDVTTWLAAYYDAYNFGVDDSTTESVNESLLKVEYNNKKSNSVFLSRVITSKSLTTMKDIRDSIYDNVLVSIVKTDDYTEARRVVENFHALFPINTTNMRLLSPDDQGAIYNQLKSFNYENCAAVADKIDDLVDEKLNPPSGDDGGNDSNGSWGGSSGGGGSWGSAKDDFSINLVPPVSEPEEVPTVSFNDLENVSWAEKEINYLAEKEIVNGKAENKFYPADSITRAEFVKILTLSMGINIEDMVYEDISFSDVNEWDWYYPYVVYCKRAGIVNGDENNQFRPDDKITREDIAVIIYRAVFEKQGSEVYQPEFADNNSISAYAYDAIGCLNYNGIVKGNQNNCFEAKNNSTRAEAAVMIYRTFFV